MKNNKNGELVEMSDNIDGLAVLCFPSSCIQIFKLVQRLVVGAAAALVHLHHEIDDDRLEKRKAGGSQPCSSSRPSDLFVISR